MTLKAQKKDGKKGWETQTDVNIGSKNPDDEQEKIPIKVELIPGFTINFKEQPIFEKSKWEYLMI